MNVLTVRELARVLEERFAVKLQSITLDDWLLFADFLNTDSDADGSIGLDSTVRDCIESVVRFDLQLQDAVEDSDKIEVLVQDKVAQLTAGRDFVELQVMCTSAHGDQTDAENEDENNGDVDDTEDNTVKLPPIRVSIAPAASDDDAQVMQISATGDETVELTKGKSLYSRTLSRLRKAVTK